MNIWKHFFKDKKLCLKKPRTLWAYWISSNSSFIQYCDSNIGFFFIAPPLVIALKSDREEKR